MMDFGEILEPSSRAFWDDFDFEQAENNEAYNQHLSNIEWEWYTEDKKEPQYSKISSFYVIEGTGIQNFLESSVIKNHIPIGGLKNKKILIYYFSSKSHIIVISLENDLNITAVITKYFESFLKKVEKVYTISLQSKIQYKSENVRDVESNLVFLRGINSKIKYVDEIKSPNFITGIAAGVATIRFLQNLTYSSYIVYTDPLTELDAFVAEPILKLFKDINVDCKDKYISKYKDPSLLYM